MGERPSRVEFDPVGDEIVSSRIMNLVLDSRLGRKSRKQKPRLGPLGIGVRKEFQGSRFWVLGSGCRVQSLEFRVQGAGCRVQGTGCRVQGARCRVQGEEFRVQG